MIKKRAQKNVNVRTTSGLQPSTTNKTDDDSKVLERTSDKIDSEEINVSDQVVDETTPSTGSSSEVIPPTEEGDKESSSDDDSNINNALEKTKLKQKLRSRPKGMQANLKTGDLFDLEKIKNSSIKRKKEKLNILHGGTQGGLIDRNGGDWIAMKLANMEKKEAPSKLSQLGMDTNFTEAELSEQDKRLFEYIRDKMKEKGYSYDQTVNIDDDDVNVDIDGSKKRASDCVKEILEKEKDLYKLPEELKVEKIEIEQFDRRRREPTTPQKSNAKPISEEERQKLLSGAILEVPLSTAEKLHNIRETNAKVQEMEDNGTLKRKYNTSSDDYVFNQFKKKYAHKR